MRFFFPHVLPIDPRSDFIVIPTVFYIVVAAARLDLGKLRTQGWLFDMGVERESWYKYYTYYGLFLLCIPAWEL